MPATIRQKRSPARPSRLCRAVRMRASRSPYAQRDAHRLGDLFHDLRGQRTDALAQAAFVQRAYLLGEDHAVLLQPRVARRDGTWVGRRALFTCPVMASTITVGL